MPDLARSGLCGGDECGDAGALLELLRWRPAWHADALCREHPEISWFPNTGVSTEPAKAVCRACLVRAECQTWAMAQPIDLKGVWGGLSDGDRRRLRAGEEIPLPRVAPPAFCRCCERPPGRSLRGLCEACFRAWRRAGGPDLDRWIERRRAA